VPGPIITIGVLFEVGNLKEEGRMKMRHFDLFGTRFCKIGGENKYK